MWKYILDDDEFADALNFMKSTNDWHPLSQQDLAVYKTWFVDTEFLNGLIVLGKDNINLSNINLESSIYCMYDLAHHNYIQAEDAEYSLSNAIYILDCAQHTYFCIYKTS